MEAKNKTGINDYLSQFDSFRKKDQLKIAEIISRKAFEKQWKDFDDFLPDVEMDEGEIVEEVKNVRNASRKGST